VPEMVTFNNPEFHGLIFSFEDALHAPTSLVGQEQLTAAILSFDDGQPLVVEDCEFHGDDEMHRAIVTSATSNLVIARVIIDRFRRLGISANRPDVVPGPDPSPEDNPNPLPRNEDVRIEDVRISNINDSVWEAMDPDKNFSMLGIVLGDRGMVSRVHVRDVRWAGIVTINEVDGSELSDLDIDRVGFGESRGGVGVYFDNTTERVNVHEFCIGNEVRIGVNSEHDHFCHDMGIPEECSAQQCMDKDPSEPADCDFPRGLHNVVHDGITHAYQAGVWFDRGTIAGGVHDVTFDNYYGTDDMPGAAIVFHENASSLNVWPDADNGSMQFDNQFLATQTDGKPCHLTFSHLKDAMVVCAL
jgi:hypothetical protein